VWAASSLTWVVTVGSLTAAVAAGRVDCAGVCTNATAEEEGGVDDVAAGGAAAPEP
jgi:hypothetical protein